MAKKKIPKENMNGDCYSAAGNYMVDHGDYENCILVHGIPTGQGPIKGIKFGHAWIEQDGDVLDRANGRNIIMPKETYYAIGNIKYTVKYTMEEFRKNILKFRHWGPWDAEIERMQ